MEVRRYVADNPAEQQLAIAVREKDRFCTLLNMQLGTASKLARRYSEQTRDGYSTITSWVEYCVAPSDLQKGRDLVLSLSTDENPDVPDVLRKLEGLVPYKP
jgi:hypothetical protein